MVRRPAPLLGIVLGLVGGIPTLADQREDRPRLRDASRKIEEEGRELARRRDVEGPRAFVPHDVVPILEDGTRPDEAAHRGLFPDHGIVRHAIGEDVEVVVLRGATARSTPDRDREGDSTGPSTRSDR